MNTRGRKESEAAEVGISAAGALSLNKRATELLKGKGDWAIFHYDRENGRIGVELVDEYRDGAYKVQRHPSGRVYINAQGVLKAVGYQWSQRLVERRIMQENGMLVIVLPDEGLEKT